MVKDEVEGGKSKSEERGRKRDEVGTKREKEEKNKVGEIKK